MSWSLSIIGKPDNVVAEIEAESKRLQGGSKEQFDQAMPHMIGAVRLVFSTPTPLVHLEASGHGQQGVYRHFQMKLEPNYTKLV